MTEYPRLRCPVLETTTPRELAEFYRRLLGLRYPSSDEPLDAGQFDNEDWLELIDAQGVLTLAFQRVDRLPRTTWPEPGVPMQMHLDFTVSSVAELHRQKQRAETLGAVLLLDRTADPEEPLFAFADLSGHPFCIFVG